MPRTPSSHIDERQRKRQRRGVALLPTEDSGSSNSSTNLAEAFYREARPFADATNRPPAMGNRVTPSTNKLTAREDVGASPQPLDHQSSASLSHNSSGSSSRSSTSSYSRNQPRLPAGVINVYSRRHRSLVPDENHNSIASLTDSYIDSYGQEFYQLLRAREAGGTVAASQSSADSPESPTSPASSTMTPNRRVVYVPHRPILGRDASVSTHSSTTLSLSDCLPNQPHLTPKMRAILIDWLIELSEEYKLSESTIFCAAAMVNASLECGSAPEDLDEEALTQSPTSISSTAQGRLIVGRDMLQCLGW
jgi:hypothetical protein